MDRTWPKKCNSRAMGCWGIGFLGLLMGWEAWLMSLCESAPEAASWLSSFHSPACCLDRPATTPTNDWISGAAHFLLHAPHHLPQMMMTPLQCRDLPGGGQGGRLPADCSPAFTLYKSATLNPRVSPREHRISPCAKVLADDSPAPSFQRQQD